MGEEFFFALWIIYLALGESVFLGDLGVLDLFHALVHLQEVGILHVLEVDLGESTLDDPLPEVFDVFLLELDEQVVGGSDEVHVEDLVVSGDTPDSFVVADRISRSEIHNNSLVGVGLDESFSSRKRRGGWDNCYISMVLVFFLFFFFGYFENPNMLFLSL